MTSNSSEISLSSKVSLRQYIELEKKQDRNAIADFIYDRFHERYVAPFESNEKKNGFIMMASACLMIEALESFWQGWNKSPNSALAFCQFFDRNDRFLPLRGSSQQFYANVRCGILHQGETKSGWRIRRDLKVLFDPKTFTIDATRFLAALEGCLADYRSMLKMSLWNALIWQQLRKKMKDVCANAKCVA
ncbi:MAG: hypothetical protein ACREPT_06065 [Rudaea sp.]